ncbi:hypothetical protein EG68_01982 [Paragonimus skrjabini miyazakii]|uniref:Uncharacterized protein n=1 Tax=Paragonimus skrjabini miyazakii TaxID=59628 RepID=A0A8S9Z0F9_9TREM|nr:hypothetical protein EG68_01982 [Paragonimus skrjabini miyazakii]
MLKQEEYLVIRIPRLFIAAKQRHSQTQKQVLTVFRAVRRVPKFWYCCGYDAVFQPGYEAFSGQALRVSFSTEAREMVRTPVHKARRTVVQALACVAVVCYCKARLPEPRPWVIRFVTRLRAYLSGRQSHASRYMPYGIHSTALVLGCSVDNTGADITDLALSWASE